MSRPVVVAVAWLVFLPVAAALAEGPPAGTWKFKFDGGKEPVTFLFYFSEADGKWTGDFVSSSHAVKQEPKFGDITVTGDNLKFGLTFGGREFINFDGVVSKDGKKITGSYSQFGGPLKLTELYPSKLKKLDDPFALAKETLSQVETGPEMFESGFTVLGEAGKKKLPVDEARSIADKLAKAASAYGPRWERTTTLRLANTLAEQDGLAEVAVAQAQRAERMLGDDAPPAAAMEVYDTLVRVLTKAGKADQTKKYAVLLGKLEAREYADLIKANITFPIEAYKGRKGKSDRVVLLEAFTTSEAPQAVGTDNMVESLARTFKPTDVIVANFHVHVGRVPPDALASGDGMERLPLYGETLQSKGFPMLLIDGKAGPAATGAVAGAKDRYTAFREAVEAELEKPATVKVALAVTKGDKGYTAKATVTELEAPGEKVVLRFILAEERVRFAGGSGTKYHPLVVRAMPGGPKGFPLTKKSHEETVTVDVPAVREKLTKYLDDFAKNDAEFPRPDRPLELKKLKLIAFVQNDATGEVLNAVQVDLGE